MSNYVLRRILGAALVITAVAAGAASAQTTQAGSPAGQPKPTPGSTPAAPPVPTSVPLPPGYVIGHADVLSFSIWHEPEHNREVVVLPDGNVTLPLVNNVMAAGLTVEELVAKVAALYKTQGFFGNPVVSITVKQLNSRKVFVMGMVNKPGPYDLMGPTTVMQLLAMAGGLQEFANQKSIRILRTENGVQKSLLFDYEAVSTAKKGWEKFNIELKPGDTIIIRD